MTRFDLASLAAPFSLVLGAVCIAVGTYMMFGLGALVALIGVALICAVMMVAS